MLRRIVPFCCLLAFAATACSRPQGTTTARLIARPRSYRGPCPATLHFVATIRVSEHPAVIEYEWERSDGTTGPRQKIEIRRNAQKVQDTWSLASHGAPVDAWERLRILSPEGIVSPVAQVHVDCR